MVDRNINIETKIVLGKTLCIRQSSITHFCNEGHLKLQNYELQNYKLHVFDIEVFVMPDSGLSRLSESRIF